MNINTKIENINNSDDNDAVNSKIGNDISEESENWTDDISSFEGYNTIDLEN